MIKLISLIFNTDVKKSKYIIKPKHYAESLIYILLSAFMLTLFNPAFDIHPLLPEPLIFLYCFFNIFFSALFEVIIFGIITKMFNVKISIKNFMAAFFIMLSFIYSSHYILNLKIDIVNAVFKLKKFRLVRNFFIYDL